MDCEDNLVDIAMPGPAISTRPFAKAERFCLVRPRTIDIHRKHVVDQPDRAIVRARKRVAKVAESLLERMQSVQKNDVERPRQTMPGKILIGRHLMKLDAFPLVIGDIKLETRIDGHFMLEVQRVEGLPAEDADFQVASRADVPGNLIDPAN